MANPTTNYGFVLPTPTDLVTDLPADFDVALQGVDTRLKALNPSTTLGDTNYASATANTNTRLAIGSTGQVLTVAGGVPTWATPASGGSMTQLATGTLSGASVTISSISGSYQNLFLRVFNFKPATDGGRLSAYYNGDTGANYGYATVVNANPMAFPYNFVSLSKENDDTLARGWVGATIYDYANTSTYKFGVSDAITTNHTIGATDMNYGRIAGFWASTAAITSITLLADTGNMTSGTYTLFGVK